MYRVTVFVMVGVLLSGCGEAPKESVREKIVYVPVDRPRAQPEKRRWSRTDFENAVLGKTREEIRTLLGDPDQVPNDGSDGVRVKWLYNEITYVPPAKNSDEYVCLWFDINNKTFEVEAASVVEYPGGVLHGR
jgi:hypothetical protein